MMNHLQVDQWWMSGPEALQKALSIKPGKKTIPSTRIAPAVAATTCSRQWRRDARVLGSLPFTHYGLWAPSLVCNTHAGFESTSFCGS